jgi:hypothetical protein
MVPAKGNRMDTREGKDEIVGNVAVRAILLVLYRPLARSSHSVCPVLASLRGSLPQSSFSGSNRWLVE